MNIIIKQLFYFLLIFSILGKPKELYLMIILTNKTVNKIYSVLFVRILLPKQILKIQLRSGEKFMENFLSTQSE